jgi:hypothetical protein
MALVVPAVVTTGASAMELARANVREPVRAGAPPLGVIWTPNVKASTLTPLFRVRVSGILNAPLVLGATRKHWLP